MSLHPEWPDWWNWELELTPHLLKRMLDREFNEVDLRETLAEAIAYQPEPNGRFLVLATHAGRQWEVIVEPDSTDEVLLVVTAYPCD